MFVMLGGRNPSKYIRKPLATGIVFANLVFSNFVFSSSICKTKQLETIEIQVREKIFKSIKTIIFAGTYDAALG